MCTSKPCLLLVEGLPIGFSKVQESLEIYLHSVTKTRPMYSKVEGDKATVKFENDQGALLEFAI